MGEYRVSREKALEALRILNRGSWHESTHRTVTRKYYAEILEKYINREPDEWCLDCKEYDREKRCCPRFNHVIRETVLEANGSPVLRFQDNRTLWVNVPFGKLEDVGRVFVTEDQTVYMKEFYQEED